MEEDINRLKELWQQQNESISTIFNENKKYYQRSKSIDYNWDNYYIQSKKRNIDQGLYNWARVIFPNKKSSNKWLQSMHRHITPDSIGLQNNRSQNLFKYNVKNIGPARPYAEYHSLEKVWICISNFTFSIKLQISIILILWRNQRERRKLRRKRLQTLVQN